MVFVEKWRLSAGVAALAYGCFCARADGCRTLTSWVLAASRSRCPLGPNLAPARAARAAPPSLPALALSLSLFFITRRSRLRSRSYLVDPASSICLSQRLSHACLSTHGRYSETANGSLNQLWFLWSLAPLLLG